MTNDKMAAPVSRVKLSEKIGYGFGDMSSSMFWKIFSYYLPFFYSNVFGLSLADSGMLLLITKLYDAISDPFMGIIADRTKTRWGKYRPYLLWAAIPFAVAGILIFSAPRTDVYTLKIVYAYVTYILMMTVYTAINVPYGAMLGVMTDDSKEKSVFSSFRMFFAYIGSFIAVYSFEPLLKLGGKISGSLDAAALNNWTIKLSTPSDWTFAMIIIGVACAILFIACFLMTKERVAVIEYSSSSEKTSIKDDLKSLLTNGPWWILLGAGVAILLFNSLRGGAAAYYFSDVLGINALFTCSAFLTVGEISQMVGVLITVPVSEKIGKKATFLSVLIAIGVLSIGIAFLPETRAGMWTLMVFQVLICIAIGINSPLLWSMFADVADYSEHKNGAASTGLIFSSSSMAQKFGAAFGSAAVLWILAAGNYNNAEGAVQTTQALNTIKGLMSYIPAIGAAIGVIILMFYPLTDKKMDKIRGELSERRAGRSK